MEASAELRQFQWHRPALRLVMIRGSRTRRTARSPKLPSRVLPATIAHDLILLKRWSLCPGAAQRNG
jgi:hypothetical protein